MIHNLDKTIRTLLIHELTLTEEQISFDQPSTDWSSRISLPTLNLFLYDVRENNSLRRHQWQNGSGPNGSIGLKRTPLFMDCFYLVSAWRAGDDVSKAFDEHELLSLCMIALARYPILNPEFLERKENEVITKGERTQRAKGQPPPTVRVESTSAGRMVGQEQVRQRAWLGDPAQNFLFNQPFEVYTRIANHDVLTNPAEVWSALENQMKAAFSYVVTLQLDPWDKTLQLAEQVGGMEIRTGQGAVRPIEEGKDPQSSGRSARFEGDDQKLPEKMARIGKDALGSALYHIAGRVENDAVDPTKPAAALSLAIMEPDIFAGTQRTGILRRTKTDRTGRFRFRRLQASEYVNNIGDEPNIIVDITVALPEEE